jgi:hypothetical protein
LATQPNSGILIVLASKALAKGNLAQSESKLSLWLKSLVSSIVLTAHACC